MLIVKDIDVSSAALRLSWAKDLGNLGQEKSRLSEDRRLRARFSILLKNQRRTNHNIRRDLDVDVDNKKRRKPMTSVIGLGVGHLL